MESAPELSVSCRPGADCTCKVILLVAVTPSPAAITVTVAEPVAALEEEVSVSVEAPLCVVEVPDCEANVTGLALQVAVTPLGSPLTLRVTGPL
jgi:hypothetical protein